MGLPKPVNRPDEVGMGVRAGGREGLPDLVIEPGEIWQWEHENYPISTVVIVEKLYSNWFWWGFQLNKQIFLECSFDDINRPCWTRLA